MKTYLVPTDFSRTAKNASLYAAELSVAEHADRIILLNSYYISVYESILPSPDLTIPTGHIVSDEIANRLKQLENLKKELQLVNPNIEIETHLSRLPVLRAIHEQISTTGIEVVIMGSNGKNDDAGDIGRNAIATAKTSPVPVLVVPPRNKWRAIKRVVLACDFKKVKDIIPLNNLKRLLIERDVELWVLNIGRHNAEEENALKQMLSEFNPKYYYTEHTDVITGITSFATKHKADLIIALPRKYSFFEGLVHTSISQGLAANSSVPVLLLKDEHN